jgi:hypothetical protein
MGYQMEIRKLEHRLLRNIVELVGKRIRIRYSMDLLDVVL